MKRSLKKIAVLVWGGAIVESDRREEFPTKADLLFAFS